MLRRAGGFSVRSSDSTVLVVEPDRGVLRKCTSFKLIAGDEDGGTVRHWDRLGAEVEKTDERVAACERERVAAGAKPTEGACAPGSGAADPQAFAVEREHRIGVVRLGRDGQRRPAFRLV